MRSFASDAEAIEAVPRSLDPYLSADDRLVELRRGDLPFGDFLKRIEEAGGWQLALQRVS